MISIAELQTLLLSQVTLNQLQGTPEQLKRKWLYLITKRFDGECLQPLHKALYSGAGAKCAQLSTAATCDCHRIFKVLLGQLDVLFVSCFVEPLHRFWFVIDSL